MAQYQLNQPDDLIECPYNSAHLVKALRFPYHLIKCRKNNPNMEYAVCPFNARHEMPYAELRFHIARCIDRTVLEQDLARAQACDGDSAQVKGDTRVPAYDDTNDTAPTEDWDTESPGYSRLHDTDSTTNTKQAPSEKSGDWRVNSGGRYRCSEGHFEEKNNKVRQPAQVWDDVPTTRLPHGLPAVLQMAQQQQQLRLGNVEKQDAKLGTSSEKNDIPAPSTTCTPSFDTPSWRRQELLMQSLARGRGTGRGTATPPVGCAARQLPSARSRVRGITLNVGRGVMCLSQFPDT